jgi:hypothetical protein
MGLAQTNWWITITHPEFCLQLRRVSPAMTQDMVRVSLVSTTGATEQPFRFLDLPAELRCQVYEELVVVGKIFYTPEQYSIMNEKCFKDWTAYAAPELSILRVCTQIHQEAEELYLSKHLFVLPNFFACKKLNYQKR